MKTKYIYLFLAGFLTLMSCEEVTTPVLELKSAASLHALSQTEVTINKDNKDAKFPEIVWDKADYGTSAVVNYVVTLTNNATNKSLVIGETGDAKLSLTNGEMNTLMAKVGAYPGQKYDMTISMVSKAYNAFTDAASNSITFKATLYDPNADNITWKYAYIAVGYPDWDYSKAYMIGDPDGDGVYSGYANFDGAASYAIVDGQDITKVLAKDQQVTNDGKGFIEIKLADGKVTQSEKGLVWGVIGDATSEGWNKDTKLEYDADTRLWKQTVIFLDKEFKFRANDDWGFNYGPEDGKASELSGNLVAGSSGNFKVAKAGAYIITLDLSNAGKYTYNMEETTVVLSSPALTLPGSYQDWKPEADNCYKIESAARDFKYTGAHYFPANTEFKFYDAGTWMGAVGNITWDENKISATMAIGNGDNVKIENAGYYKVAADTKKMVASLTKTGWEVIGDATPGGWDKGTLMSYDAATKLWSVTLTLGDGEMKFRWDGAWTVNFGGALNALTQDGGNIKVSAGTYTIVLNTEAKTATMTKN